MSFLSENFQFLEVNFSIYLNRRIFVISCLIGFTTDHSKGAFSVVSLKGFVVANCSVLVLLCPF